MTQIMIGTFQGGHVEFLKFQTGIFVEWKAFHNRHQGRLAANLVYRSRVPMHIIFDLVIQ